MVVFSLLILFLSFDWKTKEFHIYEILSWFLPVLVALLIGTSLFFSQYYQNIRSTGSILKKVIVFILIVLFIAIIAAISLSVLFFIGFILGVYHF